MFFLSIEIEVKQTVSVYMARVYWISFKFHFIYLYGILIIKIQG